MDLQVLQCVHKVSSGFWKIVVRKQIELATCGLRQITVKLWTFFFHMRFAANYSETLEDPYQECDLGYSSGVHKVPSGFWKLVARKQIELATCGLRQITLKLWKVFCRQQMTWWPEDPYQECDLGYSSGHAPQNMARARISSGRSPCYQGSPHRGLLRSVKNFQSFTVICRKPYMSSSICLRATIFQNPEGTLWTHCMSLQPRGSRQHLVSKCLYSPTKPQHDVISHKSKLPSSRPVHCWKCTLYSSSSRSHKLFTAVLSPCMCTVVISHIRSSEEMFIGLEIIECSV
jgi:hypothetical protein